MLETFLRSDMAEGCRASDTLGGAVGAVLNLQTSGVHAVLLSPHELRFESRDAIPALSDWLAREQGVTFCWETAVQRGRSTHTRNIARTGIGRGGGGLPRR